MNHQDFLKLVESHQGERVLIFPHNSPDGDTIGSAIGMKYLLEHKGLEGVIVLNDDIPSNLHFITQRQVFQTSDCIDFDYAFVVAVDCGEPKLFSDRLALVLSDMPLVNVDHHFTNQKYGTHNVVDIEASSTGELIYSLYEAWCVEPSLYAAEALYTAIVTDTGSFRYSNTRPYTFYACDHLMQKGFDFNRLNVELFQNKSFEKMKLLNRIFETLELYENGSFAMVHLDMSLKEALALSEYDTDGVVEYVRDISGVEVVAFLKESKPGIIKGSLRAKNDFDVSKVASAFGGGGHIKAAGFTMEADLMTLMSELKEVVCNQLKEIDRD